MTAKRTILLGSALSALVLSTQAEKMRLEQLPQPVQQAILNATGSASIEDIDMQVRNGVTTYEAAFKQNGVHKELRFGADGKMLNPDGSVQMDARKMKFNELPEAVQQAVRTRAGRTNIEDVDRTIKNGVPQYEVSFKRNGIQQELLIGQDGRILRDIQNTGTGAAPVPAPPAGTLVNVHPKPVQLSGSKKIELSAAPKAVQDTILNRSNGAQLEDLEMGVFNGQPVYQAAFKERIAHVEMQVASDGTIMHDPRLSSPEGTRSGFGGRRRGAASVETTQAQPVALSGGRKIEVKDAPVRVQNTLREQVGAGLVEDLELGTSQGRAIYEAGFKHNGRHVELQMDEEGKILFDPRTQINK